MRMQQTTQRLPAPIAAYFAHATTDPRALARCFTADALVIDERQEHRGRGAIEAWNAAVTAKIAFTTEVVAVDAEGGDTVVRATVRGTFPGSPIALRFRFTLSGDRISRLEIAP
jgi:ketosteroid isomerase-like protein